SAVADLEIEFGVAVDAFGLAVVAEVVGVEIRRIEVVAETLVDAARAEGRARTETADRNLLVLRVILPVARQYARHAAQVFGGIDAGRVVAGIADLHRRDRSRPFECRLGYARRRHHNGWQRSRLRSSRR